MEIIKLIRHAHLALKTPGYRTTQAKARFSGRCFVAPPIYGGAGVININLPSTNPLLSGCPLGPIVVFLPARLKLSILPSMSNASIPPAIARIAPDGQLTPRQKRQFMIQMGLRRQRPGTGSSHEFMRGRTAMYLWPDLRPILQGIDWVLIGDVATRAYMPERATKDMDILVHHTDGDEVIHRLKAAGYKVISQLAVPGYLLHSPEGIEVDVLFGRYPWLREALKNPGYDMASYPVIRLPYLIILKMAANRGRDLGDLTTMLGWAADADLDAVRAVVARYSPEDLEDLESLIYLGRQEQVMPDADLSTAGSSLAHEPSFNE